MCYPAVKPDLIDTELRIMGCGSSDAKVNQTEIDESWFETHTTIGKGGFGHVHMVIMRAGDDKDKMFAQKRQIIHNVCRDKMEMEVGLQEGGAGTCCAI